MLRDTTESMSAILGGTDSLCVRTYDSPIRLSSKFSERVSRNLQIILKEEAYFDKIVDPAAGSYYIENLTNSVAEKAWYIFKQVENKGGYIAAFKKGFIQNKLNEVVEQRKKDLATRKEILLGTNQYPNLNEEAQKEIDINYLKEGKIIAKNNIADPISLFRGAESFEELRLASENSAKGKPKVFMLTYGNLTKRKARSAFSCNFFACAGYEVVDNPGFDTINDGIVAALKNKADIIVLCSSDEEYKDITQEIFNKLKDKAIIVIAGYPKDSVDELNLIGIEHFIHLRSNVLEELRKFQRLLGAEF